MPPNKSVCPTLAGWFPSFLPEGETAVSITPLDGGSAAKVWRVELEGGVNVVVKGNRSAPPGYFATEADGLSALRARAGLSVPVVFAVSDQSLTLEMLDSELPPAASYWWEDAGRAIAHLHAVVGDRFGWHTDSWLGQLPQSNTWDDDGHSFYAEHRLQRYLAEPAVRKHLSQADISGIESIIGRLDALIPTGRPSLLHGDLWRNNIVVGHDRKPTFLDPAVHYGWALDDLAMALHTGGIPQRFFDAYAELHPLPPDWHSATEVLYLRELLSVIAHFGPTPWAITKLRTIVQKFR